MENLNFLLKYTEELKKEIEGIPFDKDDIRKVYFTYYYDLVYNLYIGKGMFKLASFIDGGGIVFSDKTVGFENHIKMLFELSKYETLTRSFNNNLNRNFFFFAFSSFETCINIFCEAIITPSETEKLLSHNLDEIKNILKHQDFDNKIQNKLAKYLLKTHITHVPFIRKIDTLLQYSKAQYTSNIKEDREFLNFLSKLRNTVHTQWSYFGKDYDFSFQGKSHFKFENGQQVVWTNPYDDGGMRLFIDIFDHLKSIWKNLILSIPFDGFIPLYEEHV